MTDKPVKSSTSDPVEIQVLRSLASELPRVDEREGGSEADIIRRIFEAESVEELNRPWEQEGSKALVGQTLRIVALERGESELDGALGFYLLVEALNLSNGNRQIRFTTGSTSIVAQLLRAHQLKQIPMDCKIVEAVKPTKQGFKPLHLEVLGQPL